MQEDLVKIYHSRMICRIYHVFPPLKTFVNQLLNIYTGNNDLMTRRSYWRFYSALRYLKNCILHDRLPIDSPDIILVDPHRIRHVSNEDDLNAPAGEIQVAIDSTGNIILESGLSHLVATREKSLKLVSVTIKRRHRQWARFRREVYDYSMEQSKGLYQMPVHPDLQKIPSQRKEVRWEHIINNLPISNGTVLDIGANWGYFCHKFEDIGFECYAVENNYRWLYFMEKLRVAEGKKFHVISKSIFDVRKKDYDIVLALSVFHHFLRKESSYQKLIKLLNGLNMKYMYLEPLPTVHGYKEIPLDYTEEKFINFILANSCLKQYKYLGKTERGRNMYLLSEMQGGKL